MDCVGCDKCRLWGKLQTAGYGTALKILFEFDEKNPDSDPPLRRTELVALINTLDRVSTSLNSIREFRQMLEAREASSSPSSASTPASQQSSHVEANPTAGTTVVNTTPHSSTIPAADETEEDEWGGLPRRRPRRTRYQDLTVGEIFYEEFDLIWRTFVYVMKSWFQLPGKALKIVLFEVGRLWDYWLGIQPKERTWRFRLPGKDEL